MRLARNLGLPAARVETTTVGSRKVIVIERYNRTVHADGAVERIHQEDFCQATAVLPEKKYEEDGGPSLRRIAEILQAVARPVPSSYCFGRSPSTSSSATAMLTEELLAPA